MNYRNKRQKTLPLALGLDSIWGMNPQSQSSFYPGLAVYEKKKNILHFSKTASCCDKKYLKENVLQVQIFHRKMFVVDQCASMYFVTFVQLCVCITDYMSNRDAIQREWVTSYLQ